MPGNPREYKWATGERCWPTRKMHLTKMPSGASLMTLAEKKLNKDEFSNLLEKASDMARDFAEEFVTNELPRSYRYFLNINEPYDEEMLQEDEEWFPEEGMSDEELIGPLEPKEIVSKLWKVGKVPVWIDISAYKADENFTFLRLLCCSRHSAMRKLYYYESNGTGPFGIKSPDFPPGWQEERDGKFDLHLRLRLFGK